MWQFFETKKNKGPCVDVIIAAYERFEALNKTLKSLYKQNYKNWKAIVVCDNCSPEFMSKLDRSDKRVRYINLSIRSGNQYGPNSVGLKLSNSEFIAYLNHDDIWMDDHLERALEAISKNNADVYFGRAAFCHVKNQPGLHSQTERLMFSELNRPEYLWRCMSGPFYFFEPASALVLRTDLAKKIGYWSAPDQVAVTPLMDWIQRLAKFGARFQIDDQVTVIKLNLHHASRLNHVGTPTYFLEEVGQQNVELILNQTSKETRAQIADDIVYARNRNLLVREEMLEPLEMTEIEQRRLNGFLLYLQTGIKSHDLIGSIIGPYKSDIAFSVLRNRTGESIDRFHKVEEIINTVKL